MRINDPKETALSIEKYLKTGRVTVALLSWEKKDDAVTNEMIYKYDPEDGKTYIYIKNENGDTKPICTESDVLLREFLDKFLEVSVVKTKNYEPGMWFMLREAANKNTTVVEQSVIDQFYSFVDVNYDKLKPYILHTYKDKNRDMLIPYVGTTTVFYDLGKFVDGSKITTVDAVIDSLWKTHIEHRDSYGSIVNALTTRIGNMDTNMSAVNDRQNRDISTMQQNISDLSNKLAELMNQIENVANNNEMRVRPISIRTPGANNMVYPVRIRYKTGGLAVKGGYEVFLGAIFLTQESSAKTTTVQLGNMHETTSADYYNGTTDSHVIWAQSVTTSNGNLWYIYDIEKVGSGDWILMLRGGTDYKIWSKYSEMIEITNTGASISGRDPYSATILTRNTVLTNAENLNKSLTLCIDHSIQVTSSIIIGNQFRMSIV